MSLGFEGNQLHRACRVVARAIGSEMSPGANKQPQGSRGGARFGQNVPAAVLAVVLCTLFAATAARGQTIIYVNDDAPGAGAGTGTSWATAYKSLQDALTQAAAIPEATRNVEIWVASGTYRPAPLGTRGISFQVHSKVKLLGGFAGTETTQGARSPQLNTTTLTGNLDVSDPADATRSDNAFNVVTVQSAASGTAIDGFSIVGGEANGAGNNSRGAGVRVIDGVLAIANCTFRGNRASMFGAAVSLENTEGVTFTDCDFVQNTVFVGGVGGGAIYLRSLVSAPLPGLLLRKCNFQANLAMGLCNGGAIYNDQGLCVAIDCDFSRNESNNGGGIYCFGGSSPETSAVAYAVNSAFTGNLSRGNGGGFGVEFGFYTSAFYNCSFVNNSGVLGAGAISCYESFVSLNGCTVVGNASSVYGAVIAFDDQATATSAGVTLQNALLWANRDRVSGSVSFATQLSVVNAEATYAFSTVQGATGGSFTTIDGTNPLFARLPNPGPDGIVATSDDDLGDLRLLPDSPAIDAGNNDLVPNDRFDVDNDGNVVELLQTDLVGASRLYDGNGDAVATIDRGALESVVGGILYVNLLGSSQNPDGLTWATAFNGSLALQQALAATTLRRPTAIWVAAGTYKPSEPVLEGGSRAASFHLQNNLAIYGGFQGNETSLTQRNITANPTILSGDLNGDDPQGPNRNENSFSVVTANQLNPSAVLDGFTVTRGNAKDSPSNQGGGILIIGGGGSGPLWKQGPLFRNLTVRENFSDTGSGGGVSVQSASRAQFEQTRFLFNQANGFGGAVAQSADSHVGYRNCIFERNVCDNFSGGAMYLTGGAVAYLTDCSFIKNRGVNAGGAIHVYNNSRLIADGCKFYGNTVLAGAGGALFLQDNSLQDNPANPAVEVRNSIFVGNTAQGAGADGAAIKSGLTYSVFTNCTIIANESATGAAVQLNYRGISFLNCFLYGNTSRDNSTSGEAAQISSGFGGARNFQHSTVQGWSGSLGGANNNGLDPIFIRYPSKGQNNVWDTNDFPSVYDDDYGDLRLSSNSPAIDSGDSLAVPADTYDIDRDGNTTEALPLDLAGNPRFYDDPTRTNTGSGNPPIDRGAYENNLATTTWNDPFGGRFDDGTNWNGGAPNSTVRTIFDSSIGLNRVYTVTMPTNQNAYSLSVLANLVNINLRGLSTSGNLTLAGPGTDQNAPTVLVSGPVGVPTGLSVSNTGLSPRSVFAANGVVGRSLGEAGELRVDGSRASLLFSNALDLGLAGAATTNVVNRGLLGASTLRAGINAGSSSLINVVGAGSLGDSLLSLAGPGADEVVLASRGSATLNASNQGVIVGVDELDRVVLAEQAGSTASVTLSGAGTLWDTSQDEFVLGKRGTANLTISDGAQMTTATTNRIVLAEEEGSVANITIGAGSSWTELVQGVVLAGDGQATLTMLPGSSLNFQSNVLVNPTGTIQGSGTINGGVFNVGTVRVGNSPGTLTINGSFRQLAGQDDPNPARRNRAGQLEMEVLGLNANEYDRLIVTGGTMELGGGLVMRVGNGVQLANNTQLPIITGARGNSRFDAALLPSLGDNRFARVIYGSAANSPVQLGVQPLQPPYDPNAPEGATLAGVPSAVVAADFDNDGDPDLAVTVPDEATGQPGAVFVLRNAGVQSGTWLGFPTLDIVQYNTGIDPQDIDAADMDGDGFMDFVVANRGSDSVVIYKNAGGASFASQSPIATGNAPVSVSAAIFFDSLTNTQLPDLLVANELDETVQFYRSNDSPALPVLSQRPAIVVPGRPIRTRPSDLDNDKRRKREAVALVEESGTIGSLNAVIPLVPNGPDGINANFVQLPSVPVAERPADIISNNFNSVATDDVIVISESGTISVLRNRTLVEGVIGAEPFAPAVNLPITGVGVDLAAIDIDGDNDLDVAIVTTQSASPGAARDVYTLRNLADETTMISLGEPQTLNATNAQPLLVVGADVDSSGIEDVIYLGVPPECSNCLTDPQNVFTRPAPFTPPVVCDSIDFNGDELFPDDADLIDFLTVLSGGECSTGTCNDIDFNNDGLFPDDTDLLAFLQVLAGGDC